MPYIEKEYRPELIPNVNPADAGSLNFVITRLCIEYVERKGKRYTTLNEIVGVLECAKLEFYRRLVAIYENDKITINGDIYL